MTIMANRNPEKRDMPCLARAAQTARENAEAADWNDDRRAARRWWKIHDSYMRQLRNGETVDPDF